MKYDFTAARAYFAQKAAATTGPHELTGMIDRKEDIVIVDVRFPADFRKAHIPNAVNMPKGKWERPEEYLAKDKLNVLYCYNQACHKAAHAAAIAVAQGYRVIEVEGGFDTWENAGYPVEASPAKVA